MLDLNKLLELLPLLNTHELERRAGIRKGKISDAKKGRSTLTANDFKSIHEELRKVLNLIG